MKQTKKCKIIIIKINFLFYYYIMPLRIKRGGWQTPEKIKSISKSKPIRTLTRKRKRKKSRKKQTRKRKRRRKRRRRSRRR